jgi:hypothetical protein
VGHGDQRLSGQADGEVARLFRGESRSKVYVEASRETGSRGVTREGSAAAPSAIDELEAAERAGTICKSL